MKKGNKPDIKITFTGELFNSLFAMFTFFESFEVSHGNAYHVHYSKMLRAKIEKYGRLIKGENGDRVLLHFFPNEVVQLIDIFAMYNAVNLESDVNYFARFVESKKEKT